MNALLEQIGGLYGDEDLVRREFVTIVWHDMVRRAVLRLWMLMSTPPTGGFLPAGGDVLREPFGNVHFAGTETSVEWKGFMEGAIRTGKREASEVVRQLVKVAVQGAGLGQ